MSTEIKTLTSISQADAQSWNALTDGAPILSHAFLSALEDTGCVGHRTGWQPYPLAVYRANTLVGAIPLYLK
ncbi:MAG: peptidogalycan biosysnthesis protein, partial [Methylophilaceae bacterium]